ncbi:hypothetical protein PTTG_28116 [Puccinia triticina 1-1 BBBD Race 1]|uniref:Uncharacterized protein n=2 Tax=Puccinia triticina TaxID=208348 RepID=A0A180GEE7_PUCT1|nr:uncharacterized protein PtA15_4A533 [Puccinia triticina]OAV90991.1 hypothetical protein PTTG_28116 [Puccinia triticina 1-1 BBBD Race 1]WAQ84082.1 hypothetical protein PtA15_4A533 [Puccinia triticina]
MNVLARKNAEGWRTESDRLDWRTSVWTVIQTYSKPLVELNYLLKRDDLSAIDRAVEVRGLTYGMILPYVDFSSWNVSDPAWAERNVKKCAKGFTSGTYRASDLTESIEVIIGAIEGTLDRLCSTIFSIFSQTIELDIPIASLISPDARLESEAALRASEWRQQTEELMKWLGWSTWGHCDPPCKPDEMCLPPLWPPSWMKGLPNFDIQLPVCSNGSWFPGKIPESSNHKNRSPNK